MINPAVILKPLASNSATKVLPPLTDDEAGIGRMSQEEGFPPITQEPLEVGGKAPQRDDFNGAFNLLSQHTVFLQSGGIYKFNPDLKYDVGSIIVLDNNITQVRSTVDGNTTNPNIDMTGWFDLTPVPVPDATTTVKGITRLATSSETLTPDSTIAVTPSGLLSNCQSSPSDTTPGRIAMVGAAGWGGLAITLPNGTDLNAYLPSGLYYVIVAINGPDSLFSGWVRVSAVDPGTHAFLEAYDVDGNYWTRAQRQGAWGNWRSSEVVVPPGIPIGAICEWPHAAPPPDYLSLNGQGFDPSTYPGLAVIYPSLVLPDMRGIFPRGWDAGRGVDPGRGLLTGQDQDIQSHAHAVWSLAGVNGGQNVVNSGVVAGNTGPNTGFAGGAETRPINMAFNYICRAK